MTYDYVICWLYAILAPAPPHNFADLYFSFEMQLRSGWQALLCVIGVLLRVLFQR